MGHLPESERPVETAAPLVFGGYAGYEGMTAHITACINQSLHKPASHTMGCQSVTQIDSVLKRAPVGRSLFPLMGITISEYLTPALSNEIRVFT